MTHGHDIAHHVHPDGSIHDEACAIAHGDRPVPWTDRRLVAVFASPVAAELGVLGARVGYGVVVVDPDPARDAAPFLRANSMADAGLDDRTDVVFTDHDRPELGDLLEHTLRAATRWVGVMGSPRHTAPHIGLLRERGFSDAEIGRVHRPIGLNIGSHSPAEIALATIAGLVADRNGRDGGFYRAPA